MRCFLACGCWAKDPRANCSQDQVAWNQVRDMSLISSKCLSSDSILAFLARAVAATMQSPVGMFGCRHFRRPASLANSLVRSAIRRPLLVRDRCLIFASSVPRLSHTYRIVSVTTIVGRTPVLVSTRCARCFEALDLTFSLSEKKYSARNRESMI